MKKILLLSLLFFSQTSQSNGLIDEYFYVDPSGDDSEDSKDKAVFRNVPADVLVDKLMGTCGGSNMGKTETELCYFKIVTELSTYLKDTLKNRFDTVRSSAKSDMRGKGVAEGIIKTETNIQHSFDAYYNASCTEDSMLNYGTGVGGAIAHCQMILIAERIKSVLNRD